MKRLALCLLLGCRSLVALELPEISTALEGAPSNRVNGSVSTISGEYYDDAIDAIIPGVDPIVLRRGYSSADCHEYTNAGQWRLCFHHLLFTGIAPIPGSYDLGNQMAIAWSESGSGRHLNSLSNSFENYQVQEALYRQGMPNLGAGVLSARTNPFHLRFRQKKGRGVLKDGSGRVGHFFPRMQKGTDVEGMIAKGIDLHWILDWEELPSGNRRRYIYDRGSLAGIETRTVDEQLINWVVFTYGDVPGEPGSVTAYTSDGRQIIYHVVAGHLKQVEGPGCRDSYEKDSESRRIHKHRSGNFQLKNCVLQGRSLNKRTRRPPRGSGRPRWRDESDCRLQIWGKWHAGLRRLLELYSTCLQRK